MTEILALIQAFLDRANRETVGISDQILDEFAAACRQLMVRQFNERPPSFTLRFSNIGRSTCQLQMEASGASGDTLSYAHKMKMLIGDLTEAATIAVMKAAGVPVEEVSKPVSLAFEVTKPDGTSDVVRIQGTYDVMINNVVYDIKSASPYAFQNKFDNPNGYERLKADDSFGYLTQGYGYAVAAGKRFGGWIVVEKSTGEIAVLETP